MPSLQRLICLFTLLGLNACMYRSDPVPIIPEPPVYCYKTLGRAACYDSPQQNVGPFIGTQQPVVDQQVITLEDGSQVVEVVSPGQPVPAYPMPPHP